MFDPVLLSALMKYERDFQAVGPTLCDSFLLKWMKRQQGSDTSSQHTLSKIMRANLKMDLEITASAARVHDLQRQVEKLTTENNWGGLFATPGGKKNLVRFLVESVQPPTFRNYMKNVVNVSMPELQRDPQAFFDVLKVKTKIFDEMNAIGHDKGNRDAEKKRKDGKRKHGGADRKHDAKKVKTDRKNVKCLKCGQEGLFMAECPQKPTKEEQELLLKKHRAQVSMKKSSDNKSPKLTYVLRVESSQCNDTNSIDVIVANHQLVIKGILDSGAEATIVPMRIAQRILEIDNNVVMSRLDSEVEVELPNGSSDRITYEIILDLVLRSKAGKLMVPSRRCLVWDINSDAILLGDDLLKAIGIDPKSALNSMIAHTSAAGKSMLETDEDCSPVIGISSDDEIDKALRKMVNDAISDGMSGHMKDPVLKLVMKHKDVRRRSLGPDPPAKVTPLVTKLKAGAEPVRCKARRYSKEPRNHKPAQRAWVDL